MKRRIKNRATLMQESGNHKRNNLSARHNRNNSSATIATKYNIPLSTIQRRRARLEDSILKKKYHIDIMARGWRIADILLQVEKGKSEEVAKKIFLKYKDNIISISTRINSLNNLAIQIFFKSSDELHDLLESVRSIPYVTNVDWSEIINIIEYNTDYLSKVFS
jgi:DNA-binding Lrp family transcriptional regulator